MIGRIPRGGVAALAAWLIGAGVAFGLGAAIGAVVAGLGALAAAAGLVDAYRAGETDEAAFALLSFAPLHLALLASGGLASPLLPLAAVWAAAVGWSVRPRAALGWVAAAAGLLVASGVLLGPTAPIAFAGLVVALAGGGLLGAALRRATVRLRLQQRRLRAIEDEARRGMGGPATGPRERVRLLESAIESVRAQTGAARAVLWEVEPDGDRVVPRIALPGPPPRPANLAGSPLRWVWEERMPLRLEGRAGGMGAQASDGGTCVVPVDETTILALEFEPGRLPPDIAGAADAGRYVGALLELQRAQGSADASRTRFDRLLAMLEGLASATGAGDWGRELAETARVLTGATGAAVASWEDPGGGRVLAGAGDDGGPAAGQAVEPAGSEMALAARAGAPIRRDQLHAGSGRLPVASGAERWFAQPRALAALPLETADGVVGVVCVWNADRSLLDDAGLATLRTLSPYAALQLRQITMHDTLRDRAERDALTGLPNRGAFDERLATEVAHFRRYRRSVSLILIDIDHFKQVNDTWGHDAGDVVLRHVAALIAGMVREADFAARLGGEEFAVVLPETDLAQALETAERIRLAVEDAPIVYGEDAIATRVSAGVSACPAVVGDPTLLGASADAALYASKQAGRNRVTSASGSRAVSSPEATR